MSETKTRTIERITYEMVKSPAGCTGCAAENDDELCKALGRECTRGPGTACIWAERKNLA